MTDIFVVGFCYTVAALTILFLLAWFLGGALEWWLDREQWKQFERKRRGGKP
jgi:hypothetical protein